jgi:3-methylcrotonyl-CoA carboxylase alpha subunit
MAAVPIRPIKKVLIANRGEIACRVMRTCARLGIATVAVYSDADKNALHVEIADQSMHIGPPAARDSYLVIDKIITAAKETGADAVHPGYGFLSENEDFAAACEKAGIIFIGPPPSAIEAMGGKSQSKALMEKAKVPLVPGYHGDNQDADFLAKEADKIGYPVLIKASAGGGGKGMRVVERAADFKEALAGAQREGKASFGDDKVLIEKYLTSPRHVEIQVFADKHGNTVYLFERDCSIQRRHQKVVEEAPAPLFDEKVRTAMGQAAVAAAKAIGYVGAGTVEFLYDGNGKFYFMEMNTRLQVEHPVTELITGLDLVEQQIRAAEGHVLPFKQSDLKIHGHAVEVRLYAEDPANNFLPGAGQIKFLRFPMASDTVRIDTGLREAPFGDGDAVSIHYDPMIAKIMAHGATRAEALAHLAQALDETLVYGPKTNLAFLRRVIRHPEFAAGKVSTHFIKAHEKALLPPAEKISDVNLVALALCLKAPTLSFGENPSDPWQQTGGWRIGTLAEDTYRFKDHDREVMVTLRAGAGEGHFIATIDKNTFETRVLQSGYDISFDLKIGAESFNAVLLRDGAQAVLLREGQTVETVYLDPLAATGDLDEAAGRLTAPMPGKVVALRVQNGDAVKKGQALVVVEAMKMEHTITAPADGTVKSIHAKVGDQVDEKLELISFA